MTELKCPVCGKQMKIGTLDQDDSLGTVWMSIMPCDCVCSYGASRAVWQALIDTKKKLDVCTGALKMIGSGDIIEHSVVGHEDDNKIFIANKALEQIKDKDE